jgi:hypothetical protein
MVTDRSSHYTTKVGCTNLFWLDGKVPMQARTFGDEGPKPPSEMKVLTPTKFQTTTKQAVTRRPMSRHRSHGLFTYFGA